MVKIEELNSETPKKNPFAVKKKTTVKREADEVYPERKGLNKPQFLGNSPLDKLFHQLEELLDEGLESTTVESLYVKIYKCEAIGNARYKVVEKLLQYLTEIQELSMAVKDDDKAKNLISISLHDIKTFGRLVNLIIILGIYPCLVPFNIGIPFEKRRLSDLGKRVYKPIKIVPVSQVKEGKTYTERYGPHQELLLLIYDKLLHILSIESDVKELLMKGSGYSDFLTVAIALATVPYFDAAVRSRLLAEYEHITLLPGTYELFQDYSLLVATPSPVYFKQFVMLKLQLLPYAAPKKDGLLTLIEFVLGLRDQEEINIEKFDHVANVILLKPKSVSTVEYFTSIGNQCYNLLVNINKPTITSCIGHVMEKLWNKNNRIVQDFILKKIWDNFNPSSDSDLLVLVSEAALNNNINVLISLTNRGVSGDLLLATFMPILVSLWSYYTFLKAHDKGTEVVQNIIVGFLASSGSEDGSAALALDSIAKNLVVDGGENWKFRIGPNQLVEICRVENNPLQAPSVEQKALTFIKLLDANCKLFVELLDQLDNELIQKLFVLVLKRWLEVDGISTSLADENPFVKLVDLRLVESIGNRFKDRLAQTPLGILEVILSILQSRPSLSNEDDMDVDSDDEDSDDEEGLPAKEVVTIVLELLSAIISESQPEELDEDCRIQLKKIQSLLKATYSDLSTATALNERIALLLNGDKPANNETEAQRKILTRAITNLNDPLVPIRAHGLYLLRQLVEQRSPVISIDFVVNLHLVQLKDSEPFVYLNVVKGLESLLEWDDKEVLPVLVALYADPEQDIDERLRVGEVLLRYIQNQNEVFHGDMASLVCEAALKLIRRPANDSDKADDRMRMSAMSLLGTCCNTNPIGIFGNLENALDSAIGILQLETGKDAAIMRRSAIVLIHDLILGTSESSKVPFPRSYMEKVMTTLRYIQANDSDLLAREQAQSVLVTIDELVKLAFSQEEAQ